MFTLNFLLHLLPVCSIESLEGCFQSCISLWVVLTSIWITGRQVLDQKNSTTSDYPSQDSSHIPFETRGYSVAKDAPRHPTVLQYSNISSSGYLLEVLCVRSEIFGWEALGGIVDVGGPTDEWVLPPTPVFTPNISMMIYDHLLIIDVVKTSS